MLRISIRKFYFGTLLAGSMLGVAMAEAAPFRFCEDTFVSTAPGQGLARDEVIVQKFDTGAGFVRFSKGRIYMTFKNDKGEVESHDVIHDRGFGRYAADAVFNAIEPSRVPMFDARGTVPGATAGGAHTASVRYVTLIAEALVFDPSGKQAPEIHYVTRSDSGDLKVHRFSDFFQTVPASSRMLKDGRVVSVTARRRIKAGTETSEPVFQSLAVSKNGQPLILEF